MLPGHEKDSPADGGSFVAYPTAERGWHCFGCGRGGDIYNFGEALWGANETFPELKRRLAAALIGGDRV